MISKDKSTILLYFWWLTEENGLKDVQSEANYTAPDSIVPNKFAFLRTLTSNWSSHHTTYWQHGDHLGSASWVTNINGVGCQHLQYMPWGEQWIDQRKTGYTYNTRYTFSGKERDEETGYSYFGARYYHPDLSIWLSVDPMADKYPGVSPYVYCGDNPVRLVDSNGMEITDPPKTLRKVSQSLKTTLNNLDVKVRGTVGNYEWEGHSDGANRGTITQQDVIVGTAVIETLAGIGAIAEGVSITSGIVGGLSIANNIDDIFSDWQGKSATQQIFTGTKSNTINAMKIGISISNSANIKNAIIHNNTMQIIDSGLNIYTTGYNLNKSMKNGAKEK